MLSANTDTVAIFGKSWDDELLVANRRQKQPLHLTEGFNQLANHPEQDINDKQWEVKERITCNHMCMGSDPYSWTPTGHPEALDIPPTAQTCIPKDIWMILERLLYNRVGPDVLVIIV